MVKVRVPATTANMGPGFDTLGMALSLYNYIEVTPIDNKVELFIEGESLDLNEEDNLIYQAIRKTYEKANESIPGGFNIDVYKCDVPMSRGLGSSATCIVGGILAANSLIGGKLSEEEMLEIANSMEGHPDNVAPALLGGMVTAIQEEGKVHYSKVNVPKEILCGVMIPDFKVSTSEARKVLKDSYSMEECVFNLSHLSLFITALNNGELNTLRYAVKDKIHEPYRGKLIPNIEGIFEASRKNGALCEFISGSGSTLLSFINDKNKDDYLDKMKAYLESLDTQWDIKIISPSFEGAKVI